MADTTLFDDYLLVSPESYPRNRFCTSLQLLQEQHVFIANKMLADPERNDTSDSLAIGDSMFHHITFEDRMHLDCCTLTLIPNNEGFNRGAEVFDAYIYP